mmetsp:Transcript_15296/g.22889  ORF Transcript_15296/g.22889 Transcript_15296/m.22889 type:complete len:440 (-) Transcript_15296:51-1370(-)
MGGNQVKALGFSSDTVITEQLLEKLWTKYSKDNKLAHEHAVSLLRDLMKVYNISFQKNAVKKWLTDNGLPPGAACDRGKFSGLFLARAKESNLTMSEILTLEAEVSQKGPLFFGVPLKVSHERTLQKNEEHVTTMLIRSLRKRAMDEEGLFRLAGNKAGVRKLQLMVDCGHKLDFDQYPVHDVSSLLKIFYRELPEPIIPFESYEGVVAAARDTDQDDTDQLVCKLKELVSTLPKVNCDFLAELFSFMNDVAANSAVNKMSLRNLVIVMAPNLLRARETTVEKAMSDYNHVNVAIMTLVSRNEEVFPDSGPSSIGNGGGAASSAAATTAQSATVDSAAASTSTVQHHQQEQQQQQDTADYQQQDESNAQQQQTTAPPPPVSSEVKFAKVLWDFDGMQGSGLVVRSGDQVEVLSEDQGEWIYCRKDGNAGYVPKNYLEST